MCWPLLQPQSTIDWFYQKDADSCTAPVSLHYSKEGERKDEFISGTTLTQRARHDTTLNSGGGK